LNFLPDEVAMLWVLRRGAALALLLAVGLPGPAAADDSLHTQIDKLIAAKAGGALAAPGSDAEFLRRVYLDLAGRLPSVEETRAFLTDPAADKREKLIDKLLASGYNSAVNITHRVRVVTSYFTATVDDQGKVETFADVYKLDGPVAAAILGKIVPPVAVADNEEAKPAAPAAQPKKDASTPFAPGIGGAVP